jgi:hypothetical protein
LVGFLLLDVEAGDGNQTAHHNIQVTIATHVIVRSLVSLPLYVIETVHLSNRIQLNAMNTSVKQLMASNAHTKTGKTLATQAAKNLKVLFHQTSGTD